MANWLPILEECATSGMSKKDWCKEHNVELKKFYYWQRKARTALISEQKQIVATTAVTTPTFVKLQMNTNKTSPLPISIEADMVISFNEVTIGIANTASSELLSLIGAMINTK